jgi:hypothetical protein
LGNGIPARYIAGRVARKHRDGESTDGRTFAVETVEIVIG